MFSRFIAEGDKIELRAVERGIDEQPESGGRVYNSTVYEIQSEDTIEITMPVEKTKLILLPVDGEFDMVFYGKKIGRAHV